MKMKKIKISKKFQEETVLPLFLLALAAFIFTNGFSLLVWSFYAVGIMIFTEISDEEEEGVESIKKGCGKEFNYDDDEPMICGEDRDGRTFFCDECEEQDKSVIKISGGDEKPTDVAHKDFIEGEVQSEDVPKEKTPWLCDCGYANPSDSKNCQKCKVLAVDGTNTTKVVDVNFRKEQK